MILLKMHENNAAGWTDVPLSEVCFHVFSIIPAETAVWKDVVDGVEDPKKSRRRINCV
jgi:hypothetical protein